MPFQSQFQLGLELTKFIPLDLLGSKATEAVINLAKSLQNSGSDLLVEHDLATIFGRCRLSPQMQSSFRTLVAQSRTEPTVLYESIFLTSGPGPTVARAMKDPPYLSMVVQLSFLSWIHKNSALAEAIAQALEKRTYGAPPDYTLQALPSQENIAGVLTACEEQTNAFDWTRILLAIAMTLGYRENEASAPISPVVLRGAMDMFPLAQHLREDRLIHIQTDDGICAIVAWAHNILDLTVMVKLENGSEKKFGTGQEQVLIEVSSRVLDTTISLLDTDGEVLFHITQEQDDFQIESAPKISLRGYGRKYLADFSHSAAMLEELTLIVVSVAILFAQAFVACDDNKYISSGLLSHGLTLQRLVQRLVTAGNIMFDRSEIRQAELDVHMKTYGGSQPLLAFPPPSSVIAHCHLIGRPERTRTIWESTISNLVPLIIALVAVAHINPLDGLDDLPFTGARVLDDHFLSGWIRGWDGKSSIRAEDDTFFRAIAMLLGLRMDDDPYLDTVALLSNRGWSVYFDTFRDADPAQVDIINLRVRRGVPMRNSIRKRGIIDGPRSGLDSDPGDELHQPDFIRLNSGNKVERLPLLCAERKDYFSVSHRLQSASGTGLLLRRTGFRECHRAIWATTRAESCLHPISTDHKIALPPNTRVVDGFPSLKELQALGEKFIVFPTAGHATARWLALLAVAGGSTANILLRSANCCLSCVMVQAAVAEHRCYIVL
jgi:hypothetical protein